MYSVSSRNMANRMVPRMNPVTFAPSTVRTRKIENGTSGSSRPRSQARNAASSTAEMPNAVQVVAEPQPHWLAWVMPEHEHDQG